MELKISLSYPIEEYSYDNNGAHDELKRIMQRGENLSVKFGTDKENYPYAWCESSSTSGFKYRLIQPGLNWISNYLSISKDEDFNVNPKDVEPFGESEDNNFQLQIFKQLIESGKKLKFTPLFREKNGYISATANFMRGWIFFRLERTDELVEYLQEKGQI